MKKLVKLYQSLSPQPISRDQALALWRDAHFEPFRECVKDPGQGSVFRVIDSKPPTLTIRSDLRAVRKQMIAIYGKPEDAQLLIGPGDSFTLEIEATLNRRLICLMETGNQYAVPVPGNGYDGIVTQCPQKLPPTDPWESRQVKACTV